LYNLLEEARYRQEHYDAAATRARMSNACLEISGCTPYEWQLDVGEAISLSTNVTVIAPTGAGKTIPFVLPLLLDNTDGGMVLIISPLKELQSDQVRIR
jgi:ATP-dependent helicase YprA (DUF1998 family)